MQLLSGESSMRSVFDSFASGQFLNNMASGFRKMGLSGLEGSLYLETTHISWPKIRSDLIITRVIS